MQYEVPIIDIAPFGHGEPEAGRRIAEQIGEAVERIGFLVVVGHGIDPSVMRNAYHEAARFFDGPLEPRNAIRIVPGSLPRGYLPYGSVALGQTNGEVTPPDMKESFAIGPEALGHNRWPQGDEQFKRTTLACFDAMNTMMMQMLDLFAIALDLPSSFFRERFEGHNSTLRLFNYPAQRTPPAPGHFRSGAHTDYGALTILSIGDDDPGGLQVRNRAGQWVDVVAPAGSFVINIGDLMMMWTNDRWLSNLHRVVNPADPQVAMRRRQSIGFFANPRADVLIECIPSCVGPDRPPLHPAVTAGQHRMSKVLASETAPAS